MDKRIELYPETTPFLEYVKKYGVPANVDYKVFQEPINGKFKRITNKIRFWLNVFALKWDG